MQSDSKGAHTSASSSSPFDPALHPLAQARTKSFDVLIDKTEAFVTSRNSTYTTTTTTTNAPVPSHFLSTSRQLSSFVTSQNESVLEFMRTLEDAERPVAQDDEPASYAPAHSCALAGERTRAPAYARGIAGGDDESEESEDVLSALDSVDSFLQTHDYVVDLRRKLQQTSLHKSKQPHRPQTTTTRTRAASAPTRAQSPSPIPSRSSSPSPSPSPSPSLFTSRPQSRASTGYDFLYSRPVMHVGSELSKKIDELRNDPIKRAELEERIQGYKESKLRATMQQRNVLEDNKDMTRHLPEVRLMTFQEQVANRERQTDQVFDARKEIEEETMQRKLAIINRKEIEAAQEEKKVQVFVHKSKMELIQRRWMVLLAFGARQGKWMASLQQARLERLNFAHRDAAARMIQKAYRRYIAIVRAQRMHKQISVVHSALRKFIYRFRSRRRHRAADTIRKFVDDILDTTRVAKVIKKFRFGVTHAQRYIREMLETEKVQIGILLKQWNRAEHELETAFYTRLEKERSRQVIMSKSLYYEGPSARPRNRPNSSNKQFSMQVSPSLDAQYQQGFPKVPGPLKVALLLEALRAKKIAFGKALVEYARLQTLYDEAEKRKEDLEKARQILVSQPQTTEPQKRQPLKHIKSTAKSSSSQKLITPSTTTTTTTTSTSQSTPPLSSATPPPKPCFSLLFTHEEAITLVNKGVSIVQEQHKQMLLNMQNQIHK